MCIRDRVTCATSSTINMHSWQLNNITNLIQSIEIDIFNRQIIFATQYEFMISNMSEPNATQVVYTTDREIQRFIYGKKMFLLKVTKHSWLSEALS